MSLSQGLGGPGAQILRDPGHMDEVLNRAGSASMQVAGTSSGHLTLCTAGSQGLIPVVKQDPVRLHALC